jgi:hypothetical protein
MKKKFEKMDLSLFKPMEREETRKVSGGLTTNVFCGTVTDHHFDRWQEDVPPDMC